MPCNGVEACEFVSPGNSQTNVEINPTRRVSRDRCPLCSNGSVVGDTMVKRCSWRAPCHGKEAFQETWSGSESYQLQHQLHLIDSIRGFHFVEQRAHNSLHVTDATNHCNLCVHIMLDKVLLAHASAFHITITTHTSIPELVLAAAGMKGLACGRTMPGRKHETMLRENTVKRPSHIPTVSPQGKHRLVGSMSIHHAHLDLET